MEGIVELKEQFGGLHNFLLNKEQLEQADSLFIGIDSGFAKSSLVILDEQGNLVCVSGFITAPTQKKYNHLLPHTAQSRVKGSYNWLNYWLNETIASRIPTYTAIEGLSYGSAGNQTRNLAMIFGVYTLILPENYQTYTPQSIKKYATGSGSAKKEQMFNSCPIQKLLIEDMKMTKSGLLYDAVDAYFIAKKVKYETLKGGVIT